MTTQEFSDQFDILFNNITSNQAPGINEYEKSVFLTKAQNQLVTEYFNNRVDQVGGGFDGSQKRQYDFSSLIKTKILFPTTPLNRLDKRSRCYTFPMDYYLSVNEQISDERYQYSVIPLSYDEYARLMQKPYAYPVKRGAWRLITGKQSQYIGKDTGHIGITLNAQLNSSIDLAFFHTYISNTSESGKWFSDGPFDTVLNNIIPLIDNPKALGNGLACKLPGMAFAIYLEIYTNGSTYQVRFYNLGLAAGFTDRMVVEYTNTIIQNYVNNHPNDTSKYHDFFNTFGNLEWKKGPSNLRNFYVAPSNVATYTNLYSDNFNTVTFEFQPSDEYYPLIEIIGRFQGDIEYTLRYIKKPAPIILVNLAEEGFEGVSIEGLDSISECELPGETHQEILERAVTLAKIAWQGSTVTQAQQARRRDDED